MSQSDPTAFEDLYRKHAGPLLAFLAGRVQPRTDLPDVAQEVWTRVWKNLETYNGGNFRPWLFQIARNLLIDRSRRPRAEPLPADLEPPDGVGLSPEEILFEREEQARLQHCLRKLAERERDLVRGRLSGLSYEELSQQLTMTTQEAYRMFHRARNRLQECVRRGAP
jgi:RNA polymerase sigma-70 factor (ECF subfamily)